MKGVKRRSRSVAATIGLLAFRHATVTVGGMGTWPIPPAVMPDPTGAAPAAGMIHAEAIRMLYRDAAAAAAASLVCTLAVAVAAWPYNAHATIGWWVAAHLALQAVRYALLRTYRQRPPTDVAMKHWARVYTVFMLAAGLAWGAAPILLIDTARPITVIYTLSALFAITGGSVPSNAFNPPGFICFIAATFSGVAVRFLGEPDWGYRVIGLSCVGFGIIMILFCRAHTANIHDSLRIRFDNRNLVEALTRKTAEVEEALAEAHLASLAKSQFLAAASHDLRQPLYALGLFSASLGATKLDGEATKIVGDIQDSVSAMEALFVGLLDISKLEAGVVEPHLAPVSVTALFDRLSQYFRPVAMERGLDLRFRCDDEWVSSDETLLEQVLSNLVSNALRATTAGGVLVAARQRGAAISLEVWDTGVGISADDRDRIFEEFVQLRNPQRDRRKGLGLGLSIARRSAALLGVQVELASRPGLGSRFSITQPATTASVGDDQPPIAATLAPLVGDRELPLLVVEDDYAVRTAIENLLARWGVKVDIVADADDALARIDGGERYGLVVSDYRLNGGMNGLDLLTAITARASAPPPAVALITGDLDAAVIETAHQRGVPLLLKPVRAAQLRALIGLEHAA